MSLLKHRRLMQWLCSIRGHVMGTGNFIEALSFRFGSKGFCEFPLSSHLNLQFHFHLQIRPEGEIDISGLIRLHKDFHSFVDHPCGVSLHPSCIFLEREQSISQAYRYSMGWAKKVRHLLGSFFATSLVVWLYCL